MENPNVIDLAQVRQRKKSNLNSYKNYLKHLKNDELHFEISDFFIKLDLDELSKDSLLRGKAILKEIESRISFSPIKTESIKEMRSLLKEKIENLSELSNRLH